MSRRLLAFFVKELVEHALVLFFVAILCAAGYLLFLLAAFGAPTTVTYLEAHANFTRFALPFCAMGLGHRLVVSELSGRPAKFLEGLPMRPWEPLLVKWVFGALVLGGLALVSLAISAAVAVFREPIDVPFVALVLTRTLAAILTFWTFFFVMGLLGKARVPLYLALTLGLVVLTASTSLELMHLGPFMLIGPDFVLERASWPWEQLAQCFGASAALLGLGLLVTRLREGGLEERLSKPMSQREVAFASIAAFALLTLYGELQDEPEPAPYAMPSDHVLRSASLPIAIGYLDDEAEAPARELLGRLESDVGELMAAAGWQRIPQLRVSLRRSLDAREVEPVGLSQDDGVLLRASFAGEDRDLSRVSESLISALLSSRTRGRADLEPSAWLRDGVASYWATRNDPEARRRRDAHALFVTRDRGADRARLRRFLRLRESDGPRGASALAMTGVEALVGMAEPASALGRLLARAFPAGAPNDLRAVASTWLDPVPHVLAETTDVTEDALFAAWAARLDALRADRQVTSLLGPAAGARASITASPMSIEVSASIPEGTTLGVHHVAIDAFDRPVDERTMHGESAGRSEGSTVIQLAGAYASGSRALVVADLLGTGVGAPLRLASARVEVP